MRSTLFYLAIMILGISTSCDQNDNTNKPEAEAEVEIIQYPERITFKSLDGLEVNAELYHIDDSYPMIVLCHQARYNKFEYSGTAEQLNALGFNCIAIDQRSGGPISKYINETSERAKEQNKPTDFLDAEQDIIAAVNYAAKEYEQDIILWGSSYSSTLALYVAIENDNVDAVISFSPGNYFSPEKGSLIDLLEDFDKPMFITSSKGEAPAVTALLAKMDRSKLQQQFIPEGEGYHGSRALWPTQPGGEEYWNAIGDFLTALKESKGE